MRWLRRNRNMKLKHWIRIIIFALLAGALILAAAIFLSVPEARDVTGMYGFYKEKDHSVDVILVGPSTIYTGFYSPLAYEEEGFTSYAISTGGLSGAMYPYAVKEARQSQRPDLYVVDLSGFCDEDQRDSAAMRRFADSIKKGPNRDAFIAEMVPEEEQESYRIPFLKYHSGWDRARGCFKTMMDKIAMDRRGYSVTKNFCVYADTMKGEKRIDKYELSEEGMESLREFLDFLREEKIENVLFIRCPHRDFVEKGNSLKTAESMIAEAGFDYLDTVETIENVPTGVPEAASQPKNAPDQKPEPSPADTWQLDWNHDFYDAGHLNIYGAEKFTKYLAGILTDKYPIHIHHDAKVEAQWKDCAAQKDKILEKAKRLTDEHYHEGLYTQADFLE